VTVNRRLEATRFPRAHHSRQPGFDILGLEREGGIKRADSEAFVLLAQRPDLPPRVRSVLDGMIEQTYAYFESAVVKTLDELEHTLFKLAERASSNEQQQYRFEDLRVIKLGRADVAPRFLQHAESRLAQVRSSRTEIAAKPKSGEKGSLHSRGILELVDSAVLEEDLALQEIASKSEIRHSQALYALSHRLGVLAGDVAWPNDTIPLGPAQLAAAFRYALQALDLDIGHRVLAFREFDRVTMLPIGPFYARINGFLTAQRILPHLQVQVGQRQGASSQAEATPDTPPAAPKAQNAFAPPDMPAAPPPPRARSFPSPSAYSPAPDSSMFGPPQDNGDAELFKTLRTLLGERRRVDDGERESANPDGMPATRDDLQSVLSALQRSPSPTNATAKGGYDAEHFKNTLMVKLRRVSPQGRPLELAEEDGDTIDLVGMLFDYITRNVREGSGARSLLTRLHVPVLRVALGDKTFFTRRNHPARELLNTIAETGARWMDDSDADPDLTRKMQLVVDHVSSDFDGDLALFENLLGDLSQHMQLLARRAEVVERRHIDAAKGRDKLDVARETARSAIVKVIQASKPSAMVRTLLEQAWTDALALSVLRQGEGGSEFQRRLAIAEKLAKDASTPLDETLTTELDAGLRQVGLHADDVNRVRETLFPPKGTKPDASPENVVRIDKALKGTTRLGSESGKSDAPAAPATPLTPQETTALAQLRKTPFGTWFEFVLNQQGLTARRKLAWFSTMTGRCLFVSQRGARTEDKTLEQLARDIVRGQARIVGEEQTSLIDRAWKAIMGTLRQIGGSETPAAQGASA
jgi:hypothetical protein